MLCSIERFVRNSLSLGPSLILLLTLNKGDLVQEERTLFIFFALYEHYLSVFCNSCYTVFNRERRAGFALYEHYLSVFGNSCYIQQRTMRSILSTAVQYGNYFLKL